MAHSLSLWKRPFSDAVTALSLSSLHYLDTSENHGRVLNKIDMQVLCILKEFRLNL